MEKERGFTLIELLVVIAILAILFGVTALALNSLSTGQSEIMDAEKDVVQTAMDICISQSGCTVGGMGGANAEQVDPGDVGDYLRRTTKYYYCWDDATGYVTSVDSSASACP